MGKTNLIEALQLLTAAESFRRPQWADVIKWDAGRTVLSLEASGEGRLLQIELTITESGRREYRVNGKLRRRLVDVVGVLPCVVFTPDDLRLVKDSAEKRRSALDSLGSQLSPAYSAVRSEYDKVVRQRNAVLREEAVDEDALTVLTEQLVDVGERFYDARTRLFERLKTSMVVAHKGVVEGGDGLEPHYTPSWERDGIGESGLGTRDLLLRALRAKEREERARSTSLVGPHRDDITFTIGGRDARAFASQGQQRTIALSWKLGEVMVVTDVSGQPPVLLLDDVMSELDEKRRHALTRFVGTTTQTFVTTTNLGYFELDLLERAMVVELPR